jgi:hypothetical protein
VKNADGSAEETVLVDIAGIPRSWSSDGKYLLYATPPGKLFLWPLAGGGTANPVGSRSGLSRDGRLSPDGHYIAYMSDESGRDEIYLQPLPPATGRIQVSTDGGTTPRWSRTSRELFFLAADTLRDPLARSAVRAMMVVDVQLGEKPWAGIPRKFFQLDPTFGTLGYDVSANGQRFLVTALLREDLRFHFVVIRHMVLRIPQSRTTASSVRPTVVRIKSCVSAAADHDRTGRRRLQTMEWTPLPCGIIVPTVNGLIEGQCQADGGETLPFLDHVKPRASQLPSFAMHTQERVHFFVATPF